MTIRRSSAINSVHEASSSLSDPQADLFFTLVAVILPIILLLVPASRMASEVSEGRSREIVKSSMENGLHLDGVPAELFLARPDGIAYGADGGEVVTLEAIQDDAMLREKLSTARDERRPVVLLIEPGSEEAAFLFELPFLKFGPERFSQARLTNGCGGLIGRANSRCGF